MAAIRVQAQIYTEHADFSETAGLPEPPQQTIYWPVLNEPWSRYPGAAGDESRRQQTGTEPGFI